MVSGEICDFVFRFLFSQYFGSIESILPAGIQEGKDEADAYPTPNPKLLLGRSKILYEASAR